MSKINKHVVSKEFLQNRPKTKIEKLIDFLVSDHVVWLYLLTLSTFFTLPFLFIPTLILVHLVIRSRANLKCKFPYYSPVTSGDKVDYFNPDPKKLEDGTVVYGPADGIAYFGNVFGTNEQAWFSNSMLRQHVAFLATTGSGKTFTISGLGSANALIWGAGYMYVDAKADLDIIRMHQSMMWRTNRIDDLFILNYIRGGRNLNDYASDRTTNTYNLLESGSAAQNTETMKSLMSGDGDIWSKRADSLLSGLLRPTHYLRDIGELQLSIPALLDYLVIETAGSLLSKEDIPDVEKKELLGFIKTLPGMSAEFFGKISKGESVQSPQVYDQWGFAAMQIVLIVNTLGGDYADIFGVTRGEIDMEAVVLQDRVFLGLLPALEGSTESVASMGRIIMAARKGVMGQSLGDKFVGSVAKNLSQRATNAPYPFINIMDEVGMMFSEGEGAVSAQARGLGFSAWYSAQDVPAMKKLGGSVESEVSTVMGNTTIKVAGRIIDDETFELFSKLADQQYVWQREGIDIDYSPTTGNQHQKEARASYKEESRLDRRELSRLREGEMMINAVDRLFRIDGPNLHPKSLKTLMINDFWMMLPPPAQDSRDDNDEWVLLNSEFDLIINGDQKLLEPNLSFVHEIEKFSKVLNRAESITNDKVSKSILGFSAFVRDSVEDIRELGRQHNDHMDRIYGAEPNSINEEENTLSNTLTDNSNDRDMKIEPTMPRNSDDAVVKDPLFKEVFDSPPNEELSGLDLEITSTGTETNKTGSSDLLQPIGNEHLANLDVEDSEGQANDNFEAILNPTKMADLEVLSPLDSIFKSQGITKEETVNNLATISALSQRTVEIKEQLESNDIDSQTAKERIESPISDSELRSHTVKSASLVNDFYTKTEHPHEPLPESNKSLAINVLKKVQLDLKQQLSARKEKDTVNN
ncbi:TraM recognition domain-containing protein [Vibrio sp. 10N.261.46.E12]|uniref:TraM recognition domain-containing protein n=1 Tax=unclassified Vibrio TaxID=2614977 RepID=UPI00097696B7|nr:MULTISPECIES: TraM recognition domain-containing protein [unclassified Vibrio]OMO38431.1 hypothetical protein BH584_17675 [Vibrio sp. 10N.261.45.E1]PMJ36217.1 hypothetical protein BCU27_23535 [Vibrio sp. 10N.286.45.B6]PML84173.1 hypothetical protein BCT66_17870 [Vibrio sp. 10N.261.49.E11]PMM89288.1 hypothetical protein BCT46_25155 [Vibrio sp. 10N.261.46.E8]PMN44175.1 hypothetical protein BCT32_15670 [Vibrio sp. 10N.261.45.E11]